MPRIATKLGVRVNFVRAPASQSEQINAASAQQTAPLPSSLADTPPQRCTRDTGRTNSRGAGTDQQLRIHRRDTVRPCSEDTCT